MDKPEPLCKGLSRCIWNCTEFFDSTSTWTISPLYWKKCACTEAARQLGDSYPEASKKRDWKWLKEFLPKDFLVQFVATSACLRKQAERHAERLGCWTSLTKTTNWSIFDDQVHQLLTCFWLIASLCTSFASRQQRAREEKMWAKSLLNSSEYTVTTKPIACSTFQRIWSPAKFVQIAFRSHLLVSSYGPTSLWACRPRLSAQTRMLHEIRQWSTVASCSHNIAIFLKFGQRCCKKTGLFWYHFAQTTWQLLNEYFSFHGFSFHDFGKLEAENEAAASAVGSLNPIFHFGVSICFLCFFASVSSAGPVTRVQKAIGMPWAWDCMCFVSNRSLMPGVTSNPEIFKTTWISYDFLVYPAVSTSSGSNKVPSNLQAVILVLCVLCPLPIH